MMGGKQADIYAEERETKREKETGVSRRAHPMPAETHYARCYWLNLLLCIKY